MSDAKKKSSKKAQGGAGAFLCIVLICLAIYGGVINPDKFVILTISLIVVGIIFILGVSIVICYWYRKKSIEKPLEHSLPVNEKITILVDEETLIEDFDEIPLRLDKKKKKEFKTNYYNPELDTQREEHHYISIY